MTQKEKAIQSLQQAAQYDESKRKLDRIAEAESISSELLQTLHWDVWPYLRSHDADAVRKNIIQLISKLEKLAK